MMTLTYIVAAVVLLGLCIFIHELGHLLGGRMVGIKAKIFSIGYGKGFIKRKYGETTYQITLIPLGGYCMFYGEEPGETRTGESYEFLSAAPWKRIVTVAMGPLFNLFFGVIIFFSMNLSGYTVETSRVYIPQEITSGKNVSAAFQAGLKTGDRILEMDGSRITGFTDIQNAVLFSEGKPMAVRAESEGRVFDLTVTPVKYEGSDRYAIGVLPYGERILVAGIVSGEVAEKAGLAEMDEIVDINGLKISSPGMFTDYIKENAGKILSVNVNRGGKIINLQVTPRINSFLYIDDHAGMDMKTAGDLIQKGVVHCDGKKMLNLAEFRTMIEKSKGRTMTLAIDKETETARLDIRDKGYIGMYPALSPVMENVRYGIGDGFLRAWTDPYRFVVLNLKGMGMLFSGKMNVRENLSGPIRIAKIAGDVAYYKGLSAFLILMAKISIILMVMNLLPIPVVDGGHIMFFTIELVRGKPLSEKTMERIQTVGVVFLIGLGVFVIFNDISMLPIIQKFFH